METSKVVTQKRETFSSSLAVFFATLGSAVGLGNIWKFPYLTGEYGGAAFLFVYLLCILLVGLPVMLGEFYIGRKTRKNAVGAFSDLKPNTPWKITGLAGVLASYLIMFFYSCVAGWVYFYVFKAVKGDFASVTADSVKAAFGSAVTSPISPIIWQVIVIAVVSSILIMGVQKGIEKITKTLMPVLFVLILLCDVRALTLPGAQEGLQFLFQPDFSKLTAAAVLTALGLAFFKLSLAMGIMITYGSYFTKDNNLMKTGGQVAFSDTVVSMLAGIAIFPAVFSFGMEPAAGPGLLFMTIPLVFSQMPLGNLLLIAFFFLTSIAATCAMLSITEVLVAYWQEERGVSRQTAVLLNAVVIVIIGALAALSADKTSLLGNISIFGKGFFDLFDYISSNILLPIGGLLVALFIGYFIKKEDLKDELSNGGTLQIDTAFNLFYFTIRYITPDRKSVV